MTTPGTIADDTAQVIQHIRHELRTPMNAILGYSEMWIEDAEEFGMSSLVPDLQRVHEAGELALKRVTHLVTLERLGPDFDLDFELDSLASEVQTLVGGAVEPIPASIDALREQALALSSDEAATLLLDLDRIERAVTTLQRELFDVFDLDKTHAGARAMVTAEVARTSPHAVESLDGQVLVVDDQVGNRDVLKRRLERMGCTVSLAASGAEALKRLADPDYDVDIVLLDVLMPEMSGYEVLQAIKGRAESAHLPVIMISALDQLDSVVHCLELGAEDYLPKPFNSVILRARVSASLTRKRARDAERALQRQLESEKRRADALLHALFPDRIAEELRKSGKVTARVHPNVAVIFCDIVGFTDHCSRNEASVVRDELQELTEALEELCLTFQLEKIKTIGDSFMAACGLRPTTDRPVDRAVCAALEMIRIAPELPSAFTVRVAIHVGPVIAGVVGRRSYQYDLWGDTVNTAARIEGLGMPNELWVSEAVVQQLGSDARCESAGVHELKGKGPVALHIVREGPSGLF